MNTDAAIREQPSTIRRFAWWSVCAWLLIAAFSLYLRQRVEPRYSFAAHSLDQAIPMVAGDWTVRSSDRVQIVNPELQQSLLRDYSDIVSRTYVNSRTHGEVMLSIAYGGDQSHDRQVHKPEVCYPAQGFVIDSVRRAEFQLEDRRVPVTTLHAVRGARSEFIAYWIVEGQSIVRGALQQNLHRTWMAMHGVREDGLLFRVSTLSVDVNQSQAMLQAFSAALLTSAGPSLRDKLVPESN